MAYATIEDVEARLTRELSEDEKSVCEYLLDDAAVLIDASAKGADCMAKLAVSCRMVLRVLGGGDSSSVSVPIGATQGTMTAGPYSQTWAIGSGSSGELYLSKADKAMLGMGNRIGARSPLEGMETT